MVLGISYIIYRAIDPLPPRQLVIAAGMTGSGYANVAKQYALILRRQGVELEIRNSAGAIENLALLRDPGSRVQAALTTFGFTQPGGHRHPLFARRSIQRGNICSLQERGADHSFCAIPGQTYFNRRTGKCFAGTHA
jgi:hypothetical protein